MSMFSMELRGLGVLPEGVTEADYAAMVRVARNQAATSFPVVVPGEQAAPGTGRTSFSSLLSQYGPSVGAGLAGLAVGLVLAKLARRRKRA